MHSPELQGNSGSQPRGTTTDPRVEATAEQSVVHARPGDAVYLEIGRTVQNPERGGFEVTVDGRRLHDCEWEYKGSAMRYVYRARDIATHRVEIRTNYEGEKNRCLLWDIVVADPATITK